MTRSVRIALVGCGRIADLHAQGYAHEPRAELYAVCDTRADLAERRRQQWGARRAFDDFDALLADKRVDAVEILTPHGAHEDLCARALAAGKHVAVQKPMTVDMPSADRMLAAARAASATFKVTDGYLFYPPLVLARQLIEQGEIGEPLCLHLKYLGGARGGWPVAATSWDWRIREAVAGRPLITFDHGHHMLAVSWYLLGEVERVTAWIDSLDGVVDSPAVAMWKHRNTPHYSLLDVVHAPEMHVPSKYYANDEWFDVAGSRGLLRVRRCTGNILAGPAVSLFDGHAWRHFEDLDSDWAAGFTGALGNFVDAIEGRAEPLLSAADARSVLAISLALQRSARERREVYVEELTGELTRLGAWRRRRRERRDRAPRRSPRFRLPAVLSGHRRLGARAIELTEERVAAIAASPRSGIDFDAGLRLTARDGSEEWLALYRGGSGPAAQVDAPPSLYCVRGELPEDAGVTVTLPAEAWAAVLLGKRSLDSVLAAGEITFEGKPELALDLRKLLDI